MRSHLGLRLSLVRGFSIVELMVAILIGLIILAGVIQVVVTSKTSFLGQEEMSFIQENARYAMDVIGKDIQGAGYWDCAGADPRIALVAGAANANAQTFLGKANIEGFKDESDAPSAYSNKLRQVSGGQRSESFLVRALSGPVIPVVSHQGTTITLHGNHSFAAGNYLGIVAEDCRRVGVIRISAVTANTVSYTPAQNNNLGTIKPSPDADIICPGSACNSSTSQNYSPGSVAMNYVAHAYYIGDSTAVPGSPALKRALLRNGSVDEEEIALGVEDIHLRYGMRSGNNVSYLPASKVPDTQWGNVVAVEVNLLMRSQAPALPVAESGSFAVSGRTYNDRHMRQTITTTFRIRNRI